MGGQIKLYNGESDMEAFLFGVILTVATIVQAWTVAGAL